ncbi:MAG: hypothetical protein CVV19_12190 [Gammaproteobacteria bacterium HGW-Gammaproteobacteria-9]|nr:MAG: hypothetical protein CVV19_12190 [Gammaproteobacteria bacterium HGW-Gammaproteobacteria-9]
MGVTWDGVKEIFYVIGSVAGIIALLRPVFESKYDRDKTRFNKIIEQLNEQRVIDLDSDIYQSRTILNSSFVPFDRLRNERRSNHDSVRFSGPYAKQYRDALDEMLERYGKLREFIQVDAWEPTVNPADPTDSYWRFNKQAFMKNGYSDAYVEHLNEAARIAEELKLKFQRFQLVGDLHLYEWPIANLLLTLRTKALRDCADS